MNDYPDVFNIRIDMSFDEFNDAICNLGYDKLENNNNLNFVVKSKKNNTDVLAIAFVEDHLYRLIIRDWKEFFDFSSEMSFINLIDVFQNYFLKNYDYEFYFSPSSKLISCSSQRWNIQFDITYEEIDIIKR